jgi:hypothetical protein
MATQSFSVSLIRPQDLLVLTFDFHQVDFTAPAAGQLGQIQGQAGALLIAQFQPQHIAEQVFFQVSDNPGDPGNEPPASPGRVQSLLAGPSRLVFNVPPGEVIHFTAAGLLEALARLPLSVTPVASYEPPSGCSPAAIMQRLTNNPPPPQVTPPTRYHTAIEVPYRLLLSPDGKGNWAHATTPVEHNQWTELWHTRLGSKRPDGDPRVRAVWSPDFIPGGVQPHADVPFRMSLDGRDRNEIVHLTSDYYLPSFTPTPVDTEHIMLSTLGAWLKLQGDWEPPSLASGQGSLTVGQWRHVATMARDHYVRVLYAGYLFPFGHRAVLVKVTERKFLYQEDAQTPGYIAYLFQRFFIMVRQPTRNYGHRESPFRSVTLKSLITPNLQDPTDPESKIMDPNQEVFWPRVLSGGGFVDFPFHIASTDWEGRTLEFNSPLIFVSKNVDELPQIANVVSYYQGIMVTDSRRQRDFGGQSLAYAPPQKSGDTSLETSAISFDALHKTNQTPHFWPGMAQAMVDIPAVKNLVGKPAPSTIQWETTYTAASGNNIGNAGQVFAKVVGSSPLEFGSSDKSGGLVAPNLAISGLSRSLGPVGGPVNQMVTGNFKPQDIFNTSVKLLGGIELWQIVKDLIFSDAANTAGKVPQFVTIRDGDIIRTTYTWELSQNELVNTGLFVPNPGASFRLQAILEKKLDASPPTYRIEGKLTNFAVVLLPSPNELISIGFDSVSFKAEKDKKVDVSVQLNDIQFLGILEFVNQLRQYLPLDGFSDPPILDIVTAPNPGLNLGYTLGIPTIGIGILTIQNISLSAGFFLPFGDAPMNFHFAFCERQQPFILTVSLFGGGGFFSMDIGIEKVVMIEAALEFGAAAAINLGVASGKASMMAGFYFQKAGADFSLTGYFRANGSLSVLGIVTVSLEFYLGLTYASKGISPHGGTLWGQAKLTVKIEILFFSTSVSISMEREFAGSDPTFRQLVAPNVWAAYCEAFADYV